MKGSRLWEILRDQHDVDIMREMDYTRRISGHHSHHSHHKLVSGTMGRESPLFLFKAAKLRQLHSGEHQSPFPVYMRTRARFALIG
jgi:hypothetical protein